MSPVIQFLRRVARDFTRPELAEEAGRLATEVGALARAQLAKDHEGTRVSCSGLLRQCISGLRGGGRGEMLSQMQSCLTEMGQRFYAGDISAVDEFLQLWCICEDERALLKGRLTRIGAPSSAWRTDVGAVPADRKFLVKTKQGEVYAVVRTSLYGPAKVDPADVMFRLAVTPGGMAVMVDPSDVVEWVEVPA